MYCFAFSVPDGDDATWNSSPAMSFERKSDKAFVDLFVESKLWFLFCICLYDVEASIRRERNTDKMMWRIGRIEHLMSVVQKSPWHPDSCVVPKALVAVEFDITMSFVRRALGVWGRAEAWDQEPTLRYLSWDNSTGDRRPFPLVLKSYRFMITSEWGWMRDSWCGVVLLTVISWSITTLQSGFISSWLDRCNARLSQWVKRIFDPECSRETLVLRFFSSSGLELLSLLPSFVGLVFGLVHMVSNFRSMRYKSIQIYEVILL